jgi:two-component system, chemotaxis family, protein-glutamate methylesterase/glutaminase
VAGSLPIVAIGASAGGVEAVTFLARRLPPDFPGAVFVAMHFPTHSVSVLPRILERAGPLPAAHAEDGEPIHAGRIYVAPPDTHLLPLRHGITLVRGPRENGNRPAIDPMFRSAAAAHGQRVIGVVLTGNLDDGTAGLLAIKRAGGIAIVQDPADALFPSMPTSAIEHVRVDHVLRLADMPARLTELATALAQHAPAIAAADEMDDQTIRETLYAELDLSVVEDVHDHPGEPSQFGCPDCGGVLWEIRDGELLRYRCRVGHAWTADGLLSSQAEQLDQALWTALRALEESASLSELLARRARERKHLVMVRKHQQAARIFRDRARVIRDVLVAGAATDPAVPEPETKKAVP